MSSCKRPGSGNFAELQTERNVPMLKTLAFSAVAAVALGSTPAHAGLSINGLSINGLSINGLNAGTGALQATRLTLPDGTMLNFR
jgi:hypothetical protein